MGYLLSINVGIVTTFLMWIFLMIYVKALYDKVINGLNSGISATQGNAAMNAMRGNIGKGTDYVNKQLTNQGYDNYNVTVDTAGDAVVLYIRIMISVCIVFSLSF